MGTLKVPRIGTLAGQHVAGSRASMRSSREESRQRECVRAFNETTAVKQLASERRDDALYACECGDSTCWGDIYLTRAEYENVRAYASHFLIARDHENPETDVVVLEKERWAIVELVGRESVMSARRSDPRRL